MWIRRGFLQVRIAVNRVVVATRWCSQRGADGTTGFRVNHWRSVPVAALTVAKGQ